MPSPSSATGEFSPAPTTPSSSGRTSFGGVDSTTEVPDGRWLLAASEAFDPKVPRLDKVYGTRGGFVADIPIDLAGLHLDPAMVSRLDPVFHLAIHAAQAAWRSARTSTIDPRRAGVIFGNIVLPTERSSSFSREILGRLIEDDLGIPPSRGEPTDPLNAFPAGLPAALVAQALGLRGTAFTLDAACASSLYALKLAVDELRSGRADAMITGGISRPDPLYTQMGFSQLRALSPRGKPSPFDEQGDGLVVGEGAGLFVLKRLDDAIRHGDEIHAVVRGIGLSNDIHGDLLAPSSEGQLRAMRAAYEQAGWSPRDVDLIECHATGTPVGDAVEVESLKALWAEPEPISTQVAAPCVLGSVKSNVGHMLTAAGAAGLLKLLLALKQRVLPPTANQTRLAPRITLEGSPFRILTTAEPWHPRQPGRARRAAISGFGFGGINAHVLIEEWTGEVEKPPEPDPAPLARERVPGHRPPAPIAIVGLATQFGPVQGLRAFQERVLGGRAAADQVVPGRRWGGLTAGSSLGRILDADAMKGHYLHQIRLRIDRFRIPPRELEEMLPQQSLMLKVAAEAVEDARWAPELGKRTGVVIGLGLDQNTNNFQLRWWLAAMAPLWNQTLELGLSGEELDRWVEDLRNEVGPPLTANRTMGSLGGLVASRIAREFRIGGPSFSVSCDEASGIQALQIAAGWLQREELDAAIVGAVDLAGDIRAVIAANQVAGGGPTWGGCGCPGLEAAGRRDPRWRSRLCGRARHGDGRRPVDSPARRRSGRSSRVHPQRPRRSSGSPGNPGTDRAGRERRSGTVPRGHRCTPAPAGGQVLKALHGPGLDPGGDRPRGLGRRARRDRRGRAQPVPGGSARASRARASGVRVALATRRPLRSARAPVLARNRAEGSRRAGVSVAGLGGTVHHVVLEAADQTGRPEGPHKLERTQPLGERPLALFALEADDPRGLLERVEELMSLAGSIGDASIEELGRRWWSLRKTDQRLAQGMAVIAGSAPSLSRALVVIRQALAEGRDLSQVVIGEVDVRVVPPAARQSHVSPVAFVYPGLGNVFAGMGRALSALWPEVLRDQDARNDRLRDQFLPETWWNADLPARFEDHRPAILGQVAVGSLATDILLLHGVRPSAAIGYSMGESAALVALGAWTDRDLMASRLMASPLFATELAGPCMAARRVWGLEPSEPVDWVAGIVSCDLADLEAAIRGRSRVYLLIRNSATEAVVGGHRPEVRALVDSLGGSWLELPMVSTVHCEIGRAVEPDYRALHDLPTVSPSGLSFYSGVWGRAYQPDRKLAAEAITAQATGTIDFPAVVERAYADGIRVFLEVGPGGSCTRLIDRILADRPHLASAVCLPDRDPLGTVLEALGNLIAWRVPVDLAPLYGGKSPCSDHGRRRARPAGRAVPNHHHRARAEALAIPSPSEGSPQGSPTVLRAMPDSEPAASALSFSPLTRQLLETEGALCERSRGVPARRPRL